MSRNITNIELRNTGLKDKLGVDIYEGAVLEITGSEATITVNDLTEFLLYCGEYKGKNGIDLQPLLSVVGNVYEDNK